MGDVRDWHGARGYLNDLEDDPLRDLRPRDDDLQDPAGDEYLWPELNDENEEND
jgi:hypothetical protein